MHNLIGRHIATNNDLSGLPEYCKAHGYNICQIFLGNPRSNTYKSKTHQQLESLKHNLDTNNVYLAVHGTYAINFCQPVHSTKFKKSVTRLVKDLTMASIIGNRCLGVIIHMGKNVPENNLTTQQAVHNYITGIKFSLDNSPSDSKIILETGASQGNEICSDIPGLALIYNGLDQQQQARTFFCIDTCHIWATGYDISTVAGVKKFFTTWNKYIGINKIAVIHFNNSKTPLNSHVDRHDDLLYGKINPIGLAAFAKTASKHSIPLIMETPLDSVNPKTNRNITYRQELSTVKKMIS